MLACAFPKTQQLSSWAFIPEKSEQTCSKMPYVNVHSWFLRRSQKCGSKLSSLQWMRIIHWGHLWNETHRASERGRPDTRGPLDGPQGHPAWWVAWQLPEMASEMASRPEVARGQGWGWGCRYTGALEGLSCDCDHGVCYRDCWWEKMTWDTHTHTAPLWADGCVDCGDRGNHVTIYTCIKNVLHCKYVQFSYVNDIWIKLLNNII